MKYILVIALAAAVFLQTEAKPKRCHSEEDCDAGECCVRKGFFGLRKGECKKLAQLDEPCSLKEEVASFFDTIYLGDCPCDEGMSCEPTEFKELPFIGTIGLNDKCTAGVTQEPETEEPETEVPETEAPQPDEAE